MNNFNIEVFSDAYTFILSVVSSFLHSAGFLFFFLFVNFLLKMLSYYQGAVNRTLLWRMPVSSRPLGLQKGQWNKTHSLSFLRLNRVKCDKAHLWRSYLNQALLFTGRAFDPRERHKQRMYFFLLCLYLESNLKIDYRKFEYSRVAGFPSWALESTPDC